MRLWKHFLKKNDILDNLKAEQLYELAEITPQEQGAFIEEFCRNHKGHARASILKSMGYATLLEALKNGKNVPDEEIKKVIRYDTLMSDVMNSIERKLQRIETTDGNYTPIGFRKK